MSPCSLSTTVYEMISIFLLLKEGFINMLRLSLRTLSEVVKGTRTSACCVLPLGIKNISIFFCFSRRVLSICSDFLYEPFKS